MADRRFKLNFDNGKVCGIYAAGCLRSANKLVSGETATRYAARHRAAKRRAMSALRTTIFSASVRLPPYSMTT